MCICIYCGSYIDLTCLFSDDFFQHIGNGEHGVHMVFRCKAGCKEFHVCISMCAMSYMSIVVQMWYIAKPGFRYHFKMTHYPLLQITLKVNRKP
jgi:hypothetical protein